MKRGLIIVALGFLLNSCESVDRKDILSVGNYVENVLKNNNIDKLKPLFPIAINLDSLPIEEKDCINKIQKFYSDNKVIKVKADTSKYSYMEFYDLSYLVDNIYYEVSFAYYRDTLGLINIYKFFFTNINSACKNYENEPYCPNNDIDFKRLGWTTNSKSEKFYDGKIELQNNTGMDISFIKFKVLLYKMASQESSKEVFFNQTVESNTGIFKGDITTIPIKGMENFYPGFKIDNEKFSWDVKLIEIRPKPLSSWCQKISMLDSKVKKMINK